MKRWLGMDVFTAARSRLAEVFDAFERVFVSFSGGKDSGVVVQLALDIAREKGRLPLDVLHIDLEAWYAHTDAFVTRIMTRPDVRPHWICLPIHLRNSVSQIQPHWLCWDPDARDLWVRKLPTHPGVIADETYFSWFRRGMEFEEFVPLFAEHFAEGRSCASVVAIRCDESLNRFRTIASTTKRRWNGRSWSTVTPSGVVNVYPIYDWKTEDVWTATGRQRWDYNKIYDLMHLVGVGIHQMRLCQPYVTISAKGSGCSKCWNRKHGPEWSGVCRGPISAIVMWNFPETCSATSVSAFRRGTHGEVMPSFCSTPCLHPRRSTTERKSTPF